MFCPKCGTKNPDDGKFCRSCGLELTGVSAAMGGDIAPFLAELGVESCSPWEQKNSIRRKDPAEVYGDGVKGVITGLGFLGVSMALFFTGVAGGQRWWWALLFPAFFALAKGVSDILKSEKMKESRTSALAAPSVNQVRSAPDNSFLPSAQTEFVSPDSRYRTGDLVPSSVTDGTTRHLEFNAEGETMTLPKK